MKKVGILTFHRAINYGAFLQAFALKTFLANQGYKVSMVDYWPEGHAVSYEPFSKENFLNLSFIRKIKYILDFSLKYKRMVLRKKKMENLMCLYLEIGSIPKYTTPNELSKVDDDIIIYGSDQIWWNAKLQNYKGYDWAYWGDYIPSSIKKIAYAASMGVINLNDTDKEEIKKRLTNFSSIAVRETMLHDAITPLTDKPIEVVCDPVFLLNKDEWSKIIKPVKTPHKYVLLFNLMHSHDAEKIAKRKAKEMNLPLIEVTSLVKPYKFGKNCIQTADALEFLYMIKNAEFIVTSSFHGTAFSVIFEKQFYSLGMNNNSGRVQSLLHSINLSERLIESIDIKNMKDIDYKKVRYYLDIYIENSMLYLKNNII